MNRVGGLCVVAMLGSALAACRGVEPRVVTGAAGSAPALQPGEIRRSLLASNPATGLAGWETRLYMIEYGPGAQAPVHIHPVVGVGEVIEGSFESAFGDGETVRVRAGEGFVDTPGIPHRLFRNSSTDKPLRFVIAYTIHAGEPIFYPGATIPSPESSMASPR